MLVIYLGRQEDSLTLLAIDAWAAVNIHIHSIAARMASTGQLQGAVRVLFIGSCHRFQASSARCGDVPSEELITYVSYYVNVNVYRSPPIANESPWPEPRSFTSG